MNCESKLDSLPEKAMDFSLPIGAYVELTKPRILTMVLVTTTLGFLLGTDGQSAHLLVFTLISIAFACGGAAVLNHYLEREVDSKMVRTRQRPIPQGVVSPRKALVYGLVLLAVGVVAMFFLVNWIAGSLTLLSALLYVLVYTPLKKVSWLNTPIGAIPGAMPPLIGWAATGEISTGAWILFLILFVWQHPHFYAIAWIFKEDYRRGGFKMLPVVDPDGSSTFRQVLVYSSLLLLCSLLPTVIDMTGPLYFCGALLMGIGFVRVSIAFTSSRSVADARRLLRATVIYLPLLLILIVLDASLTYLLNL